LERDQRDRQKTAELMPLPQQNRGEELERTQRGEEAEEHGEDLGRPSFEKAAAVGRERVHEDRERALAQQVRRNERRRCTEADRDERHERSGDLQCVYARRLAVVHSRPCVVAMSTSLPAGSASVHHEGAFSSRTIRPPAASAAATRAFACSYGTQTTKWIAPPPSA